MSKKAVIYVILTERGYTAIKNGVIIQEINMPLKRFKNILMKTYIHCEMIVISLELHKSEEALRIVADYESNLETVAAKQLSEIEFIAPAVAQAKSPVLDAKIFEKHQGSPEKQITKSIEVDEDTGEVLSPEELIIEPKIQEEMKQEPTVESKPKRKVRWYAAAASTVAIKAVTVPTHLGLQSVADIMQLAADGVRNVDAFATHKLRAGDTELSLEDCRDQSQALTDTIQKIVVSPAMLAYQAAVQLGGSLKKSEPIITAEPAV